MATYHYQQGDCPLDGYTIQYALGRGGFGEVYFAVSDAGREVALKAVQNFEEVELRGIGHCMNLKSPQLVTIFDVRRAADGTPWVIMEYISGPSLREILDDAPSGLSPEQAKFFLRELGKGLSYLHQAGVVHRDLKPHNVFFEDGIVKIGDYSLSKVITTSHRSGNTMTVGSVHYMAPEISLGRYDNTVDIYALGVILYEMLTGLPPYVGESMGEVLMKHLTADPDVSRLSAPFPEVVQRAMHRDPAERFQTAEQMVRAADAQLPSSEAADSFHPTTLSRVGEQARREQRQQAAAQAVLAPPVEQPIAATQPTTSVQVDTSQTHANSKDVTQPAFSWLERLGIYFEGTYQQDMVADSVSLPWRVCLSLAVVVLSVLLLSMAASSSPNAMDLVGLPVALLASCAVVYGLGAGLPLPESGLAQSLLLRTNWIAIFPVFGVTLIAGEQGWRYHMDYILVRQFAIGMLVLFATDPRCLIAADRRVRVAALPVLLAGIVTLIVQISRGQSMAEGLQSEVLISTLVNMLLLIVLQLLAPWSGPRVPATVSGTTTGRHWPGYVLLVLGIGMFLAIGSKSLLLLVIAGAYWLYRTNHTSSGTIGDGPSPKHAASEKT